MNQRPPWHCECEKKCNCGGTPKKLQLGNVKRCLICGTWRPDLSRLNR